jgi:hypothetical protein
MTAIAAELRYLRSWDFRIASISASTARPRRSVSLEFAGSTAFFPVTSLTKSEGDSLCFGCVCDTSRANAKALTKKKARPNRFKFRTFFLPAIAKEISPGISTPDRAYPIASPPNSPDDQIQALKNARKIPATIPRIANIPKKLTVGPLGELVVSFMSYRHSSLELPRPRITFAFRGRL